jgi:hypothetical protein
MVLPKRQGSYHGPVIRSIAGAESLSHLGRTLRARGSPAAGGKTECVADALLALRERVNETSAVRVSVNDFVIAANAAPFADVPEANVAWTDDGHPL